VVFSSQRCLIATPNYKSLIQLMEIDGPEEKTSIAEAPAEARQH
jgi:hypothetical protein